MCPCTTWYNKWDHKDLCGCLKNYINQGRFWPRENIEKVVHRKSVQLALCVQVQPTSASSHLTHMYILGNKRKRKEANYIFICKHCCLSLLYNIWTHSIVSRSKSQWLFLVFEAGNLSQEQNLMMWKALKEIWGYSFIPYQKKCFKSASDNRKTHWNKCAACQIDYFEEN